MRVFFATGIHGSEICWRKFLNAAAFSAESKVLDLGGFHLASMGWTNPTPWNTFREAPEDAWSRASSGTARAST